MRLALLLGLVAGAAAAQDAEPEVADPTPPWAMDTRAEEMVRASALLAVPVVDAEGRDVGDVQGTILARDGTVAALVIGVGGFVGLGEHPVAVRWAHLRIEDAPEDDGIRVVSAIPLAELSAAPAYVPR